MDGNEDKGVLIANPLYDTVFKYLMQNLDIAKGIISLIIDEEIDYINFGSQESYYRNDEDRVTFFRLDFVAGIRKKNGGHKKVLIELQKTNLRSDVARFRRYVAEHYKRAEDIIEANGGVLNKHVPIITIYILGFRLSRTLPAVIKVDRKYIDVLGKREIFERNDFIECLTHNSYVIQAPALGPDMKTGLEWVLSIFQQINFVSGDQHFVKSYTYDYKEDSGTLPDGRLMKKILRRLQQAAADRETWETLKNEEIYYEAYEMDIGCKEIELEEKVRELLEKDKILREEKQKVLEKEKKLQEIEMALQQKDEYIRELQRKLGTGL